MSFRNIALLPMLSLTLVLTTGCGKEKKSSSAGTPCNVNSTMDVDIHQEYGGGTEQPDRSIRFRYVDHSSATFIRWNVLDAKREFNIPVDQDEEAKTSGTTIRFDADQLTVTDEKDQTVVKVHAPRTSPEQKQIYGFDYPDSPATFQELSDKLIKESSGQVQTVCGHSPPIAEFRVLPGHRGAEVSIRATIHMQVKDPQALRDAFKRRPAP